MYPGTGIQNILTALSPELPLIPSVIMHAPIFPYFNLALACTPSPPSTCAANLDGVARNTLLCVVKHIYWPTARCDDTGWRPLAGGENLQS
jgi:hypothetical protein